MMRNSAAIEQSGWVRRFIARTGATTVALIAHLAVLFALGYQSTNDAIVDEPPAAITVEIVFALPGHSTVASLQPAAVDDENPTTAIGPVPTSTAIEQPKEPGSPLAAFTAPMPAIVPMPIRKPAVHPPKITERQTSSAKRRTTPQVVASNPDPPGVVDSAAGGFTGTVGASTAPSDVPSTWKVRLMSHLDRYKRYPEAARARRVEGTALLSFGMDRDGRVLGYYIVRSSGCPELDDEVLAMIERASPLPPAPPEVRQQIVQLVVPVRFRM
jgi:protein TonB